MSLTTKKRFKNLGKIIAVSIFVFLMFTNIKFAFVDDTNISRSDISLAGLEVEMFEATYATFNCNAVYLKCLERCAELFSPEPLTTTGCALGCLIGKWGC